VSRREATIAGAAALLLLVGLGATDFWEPDEPRHGQIAEEMRELRHGAAQLVLPRLNDEVYTQKPPLYYWLAALAGLPGGRVSEGAARLPSALAGIGVVLLLCRLGRDAFGAGAGPAAAGVLVTLPAFVDLSRSARPDALLTFFVTAALLFAWRLDRGLGSAPRNRGLLHLALGLGLLTKGPVALLLPLLGLLAYLAWERRLGELRRFVSAPALALSVAPVAAWLALAAALAPPGFLREAIGDNVVLRFAAGTEHERPFFYYLGVLPLVFLPWTLAWPLALRSGRGALAGRSGPDSRSAERFLLAFLAAGFLLLSISRGKRDAYLMPLFPALALLVGAALDGWWRASARGPRLRQAVAALFVAALAGQLVFHSLWLPSLDDSRSIRGAALAAAAIAPQGTPIAVMRNGALVGGVAYYAGRPVAQVGSEKALRRFLEAGGRAILLEGTHIGEVQQVAAIEVAFQQVVNGDEILVVVPAGARE
jgi:4-amino-4-deoxy-L-arabinose transferase-like glycosyltransferase